jgi:uncharacterized protein (TIGR00369 family)
MTLLPPSLPIPLETLREVVENTLPYVRKLGVKLLKAEPGYAELLLPFDMTNTNHIQTLHAGAIYTFAETVGGVALLTTGFLDGTLVVKKGEIHYLKGVREDLYGYGKVTEEKLGEWKAIYEREKKVEMPIEVKMSSSGGTEMARATLYYYMKARS